MDRTEGKAAGDYRETRRAQLEKMLVVVGMMKRKKRPAANNPYKSSRQNSIVNFNFASWNADSRNAIHKFRAGSLVATVL